MPNDEWQTPSWLLNIFEGWDDPCLPGRTDGLQREWGPRAYVNPPYSNPLPWVEKALCEAKKGKRIVMLLRHDSSTEWWRKLHEGGGHFLAIVGRLHHSNSRAASPFPSVLVILNGTNEVV